jgi:hypothetical protein
VVMYDTVKPPPSQAVTENGQTYDVLNRGQGDGTHAGMHKLLLLLL